MAKEARGMQSGKTYQASDLDNEVVYAAMCQEPLVDETGDMLIPVFREGARHFRRLGLGIKLRAAKRGGRSQRHDNCILDLLKLLETAAPNVTFFTNVFEDHGVRQKKLLTFPRDAMRHWYREQRIIFPDRLYIQPDLTGSDTRFFSPMGIAPAVIIEVIDRHYPEYETFDRLVALSKAAHQVYFYILSPGKEHRKNKFNDAVEFANGDVHLRITYALIGGALVINGECATWPRADYSQTTKLMHNRLLKSDALR